MARDRAAGADPGARDRAYAPERRRSADPGRDEEWPGRPRGNARARRGAGDRRQTDARRDSPAVAERGADPGQSGEAPSAAGKEIGRSGSYRRQTAQGASVLVNRNVALRSGFTFLVALRDCYEPRAQQSQLVEPPKLNCHYL